VDVALQRNGCWRSSDSEHVSILVLVDVALQHQP